MSGDDDQRPQGGIKGDTRRADRLATALRANLSRRKQRARKLAAGGGLSSAAADVSETDGEGPET